MSTIVPILTDNTKCNKCKTPSQRLLSAYTYAGTGVGSCHHFFCENCFKTENTIINNSASKPKCPCCKQQFYDCILSLEEALLIGKAAFINHEADHRLRQHSATSIQCHDMCNQAITIFEQALSINPNNLSTLMCLSRCYSDGIEYCVRSKFTQ